jgi:hypothetical protein
MARALSLAALPLFAGLAFGCYGCPTPPTWAKVTVKGKNAAGNEVTESWSFDRNNPKETHPERFLTTSSGVSLNLYSGGESQIFGDNLFVSFNFTQPGLAGSNGATISLQGSRNAVSLGQPTFVNAWRFTGMDQHPVQILGGKRFDDEAESQGVLDFQYDLWAECDSNVESSLLCGSSPPGGDIGDETYTAKAPTGAAEICPLAMSEPFWGKGAGAVTYSMAKGIRIEDAKITQHCTFAHRRNDVICGAETEVEVDLGERKCKYKVYALTLPANNAGRPNLDMHLNAVGEPPCPRSLSYCGLRATVFLTKPEK